MGLWAADPPPAAKPDPRMFEPGAYITDEIRLLRVVSWTPVTMWLEDARSDVEHPIQTAEVEEGFHLVRPAPAAPVPDPLESD